MTVEQILVIIPQSDNHDDDSKKNR